MTTSKPEDALEVQRQLSLRKHYREEFARGLELQREMVRISGLMLAAMDRSIAAIEELDIHGFLDAEREYRRGHAMLLELDRAQEARPSVTYLNPRGSA